MTSPTPVVAPDDTTLDRCASCGHPRSQHDALGLRWCAVTARGASPRGCVCSGSARSGRGVTHY